MTANAGSVCICGMPQSGKTKCALHFFSIDAGMALWLTPIVHWEEKEYFGGYKICYSIQDVVKEQSSKDEKGQPKKPNPKVVFVYEDKDIGMIDKYFSELVRRRKNLAKSGYPSPSFTMYWDECHTVASRYATVDNVLVQAIAKCANYAVRSVIITQKLSMTSNMAVANCHEWYFYTLYPGEYTNDNIKSLQMPEGVKKHIGELGSYKYAHFKGNKWYLGDSNYNETLYGGEVEEEPTEEETEEELDAENDTPTGEETESQSEGTERDGTPDMDTDSSPGNG